MKKYILISIFLIMGMALQATILHVDNKPNRPSGYYSDINVAMTNASAGDTLFIYPSNVRYGNYYGDVTVKKKLHFIGVGYDGNNNFGSRFRTMTLDTATSPASNPSGSSFQGLTVGSISVSKANINNITINGNYISSYIELHSSCSGWIIENNFIDNYININGNSNITIRNNIFDGTYGIYTSSSSSVIISHNLFMNWRYFYNVFNATVSNNIFICYSATNTSYMNNNTFVNNISWRSSSTPYTLPPASNTGTGNISNQDPQFETAASSGSFDYTKDYHLKSTSPAKNAASDGTDIGPYGGTNPFIWGGAFTIPSVTEMYIKNPVVNQGTNINIKVKAKKADL